MQDAAVIGDAGVAVAGQQERAVQIDEFGHLAEQGGRRHGQGGADHAADHDLQLQRLGRPDQFEGGGQATGLVQFYVHGVITPGQVRKVRRHMAAFVGADRHGAGHADQRLVLSGWQRLFDEHQVRRARPLRKQSRIGKGHAGVRIGAQRDIGAQTPAHLDRRLGLSRLIAISGIWAGTAIAIIETADATWVSVFAFLATGAVVHSFMRRDSYLGGLGIVVAWLVVGLAVSLADQDPPSWLCVFAFLTSGAVANSRGDRRGLAATIWWGLAGLIMVASDGWYWLGVIAFVLTVSSLGFGGFSFPRRLEWDLFDRDEDGDRVRVVR